MHDASVCFWETPLPLDVEPRLMILPSRHSEEFFAPKHVRVLCGGYKIIDTGSGRIVVNVAERVPRHVLAARAAVRAADGDGGARLAFGNAPHGRGDDAGAGALAEDGAGAEELAVCNHNVPAVVEEGGEAVAIVLPELEAEEEVDLEFSV